MKNLIIAVITATVFLCSCSKDNDSILNASNNGTYSLQSQGQIEVITSNKLGSSKVNYEIKDGRIILSSSDDFEDFLHILSTHNLDEWEQSIQFKSYRTAKQLDERIKQQDFTDVRFVFDDLELASVLNAQGIIQINPYLIKLDPHQQKVFVLDIREESEYEQLISATQATIKIKEFSFQDDVWFLLENGLNSEQGNENATPSYNKRCRELKSKNKNAKDLAAICDCGSTFWQQVSIYVWYNKFGIWETVKAQFANNHNDIIGLSNAYYKDANITSGFIHYYLDERCGPNISGNYQIPTGLESFRIYVIRKSKKPLQRNMSSITMQSSFNYIIGPPQGNQTLQATLNNF